MLKHSDGKAAFSGLMPGKDGKLPKMEGRPAADKPMDKPAEDDDHSELHDNHDGTYTAICGGQSSEPMSLEEATEYIKAHHSGGDDMQAQPAEAHDHEGLSGFGG